jgi:hypothetical protein
MKQVEYTERIIFFKAIGYCTPWEHVSALKGRTPSKHTNVGSRRNGPSGTVLLEPFVQVKLVPSAIAR